MTTAAIDSLLARLGTVGGRIVLVENRLKVRAPAPLPHDLVAGLRAAKAEILARLQETRPVWAAGRDAKGEKYHGKADKIEDWATQSLQ